MTDPEPRVVIEAHLLRTQATLDALVHGTAPVRTRRAVPRLLMYSLVTALVIAAGVVAAEYIIGLIQAGRH
ncbi:hypothetical protein [Nocardia huaxiensis]|uniref:Uncharacterized protein n=1 Tax=Nocardia huaxiensis TaxID=2755382 RepID=A0A7D6ZKG4_9NOCA|nr:hypothetical protein [Nocardia huaxiensis]QLY32847.1 hypothetical protein H0264_11895 [Nocardia huaxiensis]UFS93397.1 hypothetical protein LPY97_21450 [Nocardia huaxiensis]